MKKILYAIAIIVSTSLALVSCTEDEVRPTEPQNSGIGTSNDPFKNP